MKEIAHFKDSGNPVINVALAGINKLDWAYATSRELESTSIVKMGLSKFDVLPIQNEDGHYTRCYRTEVWGKYDTSNIVRHDIAKDDRLYYLTSIHDAIRKFAETKRKFFFLDNQSDIVGLITIANLNCKHVYLYLYNLVAQVEQSMGRFVYACGLKDKELYLELKKRVGSKNSLEAIQRYDADDKNGLDYNFIEYLYLTDLCFIFKKFGLTGRLELQGRELDDIIGRLNTVRLVVAHPNKSLIRNEHSVREVYRIISDIDVLLESLVVPTKE